MRCGRTPSSARRANDLLSQRLYGQLNLDDFPVNHLKDDFLWDGAGTRGLNQLLSGEPSPSSEPNTAQLVT